MIPERAPFLLPRYTTPERTDRSTRVCLNRVSLWKEASLAKNQSIFEERRKEVARKRKKKEALLNDLWVEDFSESYLGKTARGPRGPNYPPVALI